MALNLYRRHASNCPGGRALHETSYEADELRRTWRKFLPHLFVRHLEPPVQAEKHGEDQLALSQSNGQPVGGRRQLPPLPPSSPSPLIPSAASKPNGVTIERATGAFLAEHAESSTPNTQKKHSIIIDKLKAYFAGKGYVMIGQWGPIDVREFRHSWDVSSAPAGKNMSIVKAFFEFALSNEWITRNPARLVKNPRGRMGDDQ